MAPKKQKFDFGICALVDKMNGLLSNDGFFAKSCPIVNNAVVLVRAHGFEDQLSYPTFGFDKLVREIYALDSCADPLAHLQAVCELPLPAPRVAADLLPTHVKVSAKLVNGLSAQELVYLRDHNKMALSQLVANLLPPETGRGASWNLALLSRLMYSTNYRDSSIMHYLRQGFPLCGLTEGGGCVPLASSGCSVPSTRSE